MHRSEEVKHVMRKTYIYVTLALVCGGCAFSPHTIYPPASLKDATYIELSGTSPIQTEFASRVVRLREAIDAKSKACCVNASQNACREEVRQWDLAWQSAARVGMVIRSTLSSADKRDAIQLIPVLRASCTAERTSATTN